MSIELSPQQGAAKAAFDDAELVRLLREPTFERGLDEKWIDVQRNCAADRIEALIAERDEARARAGACIPQRSGVPCGKSAHVALGDAG